MSYKVNAILADKSLNDFWEWLAQEIMKELYERGRDVTSTVYDRDWW